MLITAAAALAAVIHMDQATLLREQLLRWAAAHEWGGDDDDGFLTVAEVDGEDEQRREVGEQHLSLRHQASRM